MIAKLDHKLAEFDPQIEADLRRCIFRMNNRDADILKILAMITVNYMKMCLKERNGKTEFQLAEKFLDSLPATDDLFLENVLMLILRQNKLKMSKKRRELRACYLTVAMAIISIIL